MKTIANLLATVAMSFVAVAAANGQSFGGFEPMPENTIAPTTNVNRNSYPRINEDLSVIFRVNAPEAKDVKVDIGGVKYDMSKSEKGIWTVTTRPQVPGFHYYSLIVDGYSFADPASESFYGCGRVSSAIEIPEDGTEDFEVRDVPHGEVNWTFYYSEYEKEWRPLIVYTPAGYGSLDKNGRPVKYPVVYIQHGGGEDHRGWMQQGRVAQIMDNLIAAGKAEPMIVVSSNSNVKAKPGSMRMGGGYSWEGQQAFYEELTGSVIPFVEKTFNVKADRRHRALCGLSMGGGQSFYIGLRSPELFANVGVFSTGMFGGISQASDIDLEKEVPGIYSDTKAFNEGLDVFFMTCGEQDPRIEHTRNIVRQMQGKGVDVSFNSYPGDHEWQVWRKSFHEFARMLFKQEIVSTADGVVKGYVEDNGVLAWKGIPYASAERFMPPTPVGKWEGVRECLEWGPQAMQGGRMSDDPSRMSEDCCVLNVWTGSVKGKKPVMLWCHGGGFDSGTSAWNPGHGLAEKDVVVVSLNHRLNIMGFLDLSKCGDKYKYSGNVGMMDVVAALEWIRTNIEKFGGDPDNVTVFGESGGGGKVGTLMCMPAAKDLFHKAIIMSGTILNVNTKAITEELGLAVLSELGIDPSEVEKINDVPYDELYAAGQRALANSIGRRSPGTPMMWGFGPTPDGEVVLCQPFQPDFPAIACGKPLVIGTTFNELQRTYYRSDMNSENAREMLERTFGDDTDDYIKAFAKAWPAHIIQDLPSIDWLFRPKTIITADAASKTLKAPVYNYMFTWKSPVTGVSAHGAELNFCFNTLELAGNDCPNPTEGDRFVAEVMSQSWANFAHTGDPNVAGQSVWHPYTAKNGECFIFDRQCGVRNNFDRNLEKYIDRHCFEKLDKFRKTGSLK